jgi:hypothetical protein
MACGARRNGKLTLTVLRLARAREVICISYTSRSQNTRPSPRPPKEGGRDDGGHIACLI